MLNTRQQHFELTVVVISGSCVLDTERMYADTRANDEKHCDDSDDQLWSSHKEQCAPKQTSVLRTPV